jgi:hypothetical protein
MGRINQEKEKFWRKQMALAERHAGSVDSFCRAHGLSPHTFSYWRHKFNKGKASHGLVPSPFVPVEIVPTARSCGLPDPKWLAEFISHLTGARQ